MTYRDHFKRGIDDDFRKSPSDQAVYWEVLCKMNAGFFERSYIDIFVQSQEGRRYDIYDAWIFAQLYAMAGGGEDSDAKRLQILRLPIGREPSSDKKAAENTEKLAALPDPFRGTFWGGPGDADGNVSWDCPVEVAGKRWGRQAVPLEVGTTRCVTTWLHLFRSGWLARWPYGSTSVYILRMDDPGFRRSLVALLPEKLRRGNNDPASPAARNAASKTT